MIPWAPGHWDTMAVGLLNVTISGQRLSSESGQIRLLKSKGFLQKDVRKIPHAIRVLTEKPTQKDLKSYVLYASVPNEGNECKADSVCYAKHGRFDVRKGGKGGGSSSGSKGSSSSKGFKSSSSSSGSSGPMPVWIKYGVLPVFGLLV